MAWAIRTAGAESFQGVEGVFCGTVSCDVDFTGVAFGVPAFEPAGEFVPWDEDLAEIDLTVLKECGVCVTLIRERSIEGRYCGGRGAPSSQNLTLFALTCSES